MTLTIPRSEQTGPVCDNKLKSYFAREGEKGSEETFQDRHFQDWLKGLRHKCHNGLQQQQNHFYPAIPERPCDPEVYLKGLCSGPGTGTFNLNSPRFVGHMTGGLPEFMEEIAKFIARYNQNLVKWETSGSFSFLEEQTLFMLHNLIYQMPRSFYKNISEKKVSIGSFGSGGTIANLHALWVARANAFGKTADFGGVNEEGLRASLDHYDYRDAVVIVSERGHYSLKKSANVLGLGAKNLLCVRTRGNEGKICLSDLQKTMKRCKEERLKIIALTAIAGSTETGAVDPLLEMADLAKEYECHFHVDAAWGGATLISESFRYLLKGIDKADSVTLDPHKQFYTPMGTGCLLFKNSEIPASCKQAAEYIIREDSGDAGRYTLEGSRPNHSLYVHASLNILGKKGLSDIINQGIYLSKEFARMIRDDPDFQLTSEPELNILTYRFFPEGQNLSEAQLDYLCQEIQKEQTLRGLSFVSRTRLPVFDAPGKSRSVFRVVLANPLTSADDLRTILEEQRSLGESLLQMGLSSFH